MSKTIVKPERWTIFVDYRCNIRCPKCAWHGNNYPKGNFWEERKNIRKSMDFDIAAKCIDKLCANGVYSVNLTAPGELFLYQDWEKLAQYSFKKKMTVSTVSNGSMIDDKMANRMKNSGISIVYLSLDSVDFEQYSILQSNSKQHFHNSITAANTLSKYGIKTHIYTVMQKNYESAAQGVWEKVKRENIVDSFVIAKMVVFKENSSLLYDKKNSFIFTEGVCNGFANYSIFPDLTTLPCCGLHYFLFDDNRIKIPKLNFLNEEYESIISAWSNQYYDFNSALSNFCKRCAIFSGADSNTKQENYSEDGKWLKIGSNSETLYLPSLENKINRLKERYAFKKIIIFGTGIRSLTLLKNFLNEKMNVIALADNDVLKQNSLNCGIPVISPDDIIKLKPDCVIVTSITYRNIILQQLKNIISMNIEIEEI